MTADPLLPINDLADVRSWLGQARAAVDAGYRHRALRRYGGQVAAEVSLRAAVASAALAGSRYPREEVRGGTVTDPVVQGALRVAEALPGLADRWPQAPRQVLARLHLLAARGTVADGLLGRPVAEPAVAARLDTLAALVTGPTVAALVRAAVVHGELLALRAFPGPYQVVACAAARLELISSGFDPRGLVGVEAGHLAREPEYVGAAGAFATGTPDGIRSWLRHYTTAVIAGAEQISEVATAVDAIQAG